MVLEELVQCAGELQRAGKVPVAIRLYEDWLKAPAPGLSHVARFNLAVLLSDSGLPAEAEHQLRQAIESYPKFCQAYFNLGLAVERQCRQDEALGYWIKVTTLADLTQPDQKEVAIGALNQIGRLQEQLKNYPQAENALKQSLLLKPKQPDALQHWIHLRQKQCKWPVYEPFGEVSEYDMLMATSPLAMLALTDDPLRQLLSAHSFVSRKFNFPVAKDRPGPYKHNKIRLGYVSGDLCTHAVGLLLPDFLEAHDKKKFELYAYDFSPEDGSTTRSRLKAVFDHFTDIRNMPDAEVAKRIRAHEIDILIDLHGLSSGARPEIFTQRPAPIQMTWLGYIGTTTFPWIDYVIADEHSIPQELESLFSEKVIRLQGSFLPGRPAPTNPVQSSTKVGPSDQAVIGCLNNIYKIKPDMLRVWGKILLEHPNVELLLLDDNATATENIKAFLLNMGVPEDRIRFYKRGPYAEYKQVMKSLTVYLDTYPYNAGSTARDVIDAGVPMVTLSGRTFVSRMCGGVLKSFGMAECVTTSYSQYKSKVIDYLKGDCKVPVDDAGGSSVTCAESCASLEAEIQALYNSATQLV
jgi:predicted O-linked N-acetylglucosamine transferase (SPINDLY family)